MVTNYHGDLNPSAIGKFNETSLQRSIKRPFFIAQGELGYMRGDFGLRSEVEI